MLSGYRTFAATAAFMGVTEDQVGTWVDGADGRGDGPLVARLQADGSRLILHEDLVAFRRPLGFASSSDNSTPYGSEMSQSSKRSESQNNSRPTVHDPPIIGLCGEAAEPAPPAKARHLRLVR